MLKTLAMFPGQGSQFVGMGKELLDLFPYSRCVFEEAEDAIKVNLRKLCFEGPESDLKLTANTQPALLTVSNAVWLVLKKELGFNPQAFAGHSLGEYSALVASGKLDFAKAIYLVRKRGQAMQTAVPNGVGSMAAVMRMDAEDLSSVCSEVSEQTGKPVELANYNSPQQIVIAGYKESVDEVVARLKSEKKRAILLPVSAPFHSSLMKPAKEAMLPLLEEAEIVKNDSIIIPNITADATADYSAQFLADQIDGPVKWTQTLQAADNLGSSTFVEIGSGSVLSGLVKRTLKDSVIINTSDIKMAIDELSKVHTF